MKKLDSYLPTVHIIFHGNDATATVRANPDLARAAWDLCSAHTDANIRIDVAPRLADALPVEWTVNITSPAGRRTALLTQRKLAGHVSVVAA